MSSATKKIYAFTDKIDWSLGCEKISEQWMSACHLATREIIALEFRKNLWKGAAILGWWVCAVFACAWWTA